MYIRPMHETKVYMVSQSPYDIPNSYIGGFKFFQIQMAYVESKHVQLSGITSFLLPCYQLSTLVVGMLEVDCRAELHVLVELRGVHSAYFNKKCICLC